MPDTFKNLVNDTEDSTSSSKQGCRASSLNASLAGAVLNPMIGPTLMMQILLHIGVNCGSRTPLSKLLNNVGEQKVKQAKGSRSSLKRRCKVFRQLTPGGARHIPSPTIVETRRKRMAAQVQVQSRPRSWSRPRPRPSRQKMSNILSSRDKEYDTRHSIKKETKKALPQTC